MSQDSSRSGVWLVLMAAMLWGTTGTSQAFAPAGFDPMVIGTLRLAIGGVSMLLIVLLKHSLVLLYQDQKFLNLHMLYQPLLQQSFLLRKLEQLL